MGRARPERELVEQAYKRNRNSKAHEIAEEIGLIDSMGFDKAVDYVRQVKKSMKAKGEFPKPHYAPDQDRLDDIKTLFELRGYDLPEKTLFRALLLHCYYQLKDTDDSTHMAAIPDTYTMNSRCKNPLHISVAIKACEIAVEHYMRTRDETLNEKSRAKGFPDAGLNYTDERFIEKLSITDEELPHMKSIKRG